jgi:peptidyl-prolyl cis-trans isomerase-like protein 2
VFIWVPLLIPNIIRLQRLFHRAAISTANNNFWTNGSSLHSASSAAFLLANKTFSEKILFHWIFPFFEMGKKSDKMYITASEWQQEFGGLKKQTPVTEFKRLPFYCCALTFTPFENPVCTPDGTVFDLVNILPWLKKHGTNPITGMPLEGKSLIKLHWTRNDLDEYMCPVTFKVFTENTHIVAIRTSGNVYSFDAVEELNIKPKNWKDLLTDEKFNRKDIISIQDPHQLTSRNLLDFDFIKKGIKVKKVDLLQKEPNVETINQKGSTGRILEELSKSKEKKEETPSFIKKEKKQYNEAHFSTGLTAYSLTSMSFTPNTKTVAAVLSDEDYLFKNVKEKGTIQIRTNLGEMTFELYCKEAPKTTYNFIKLAKAGYYNGTKFHRSIRNFMLQGGDPTGTGSGGESYWKKQFEDEFHPLLKHNTRGMLSMANRGKNTNTSQFFVTYAACPHLNNKHSVFGILINGDSCLSNCEGVGTSNTDVPLTPIVIIEMQVLNDPFENLLNKDETVEMAMKQKREKVTFCLYSEKRLKS